VRTLLVDNYDSYTFNLFQLLCVVTGTEPRVVRNDELTAEELDGLDAERIVISPGPGSPGNERDFGICRELLLRARVPVLGVCLGAQGLAAAYGGRVVHAPAVAHGRISRVRHDGSALFAGIPPEFDAVRYHSLTVDPELPPVLRATAWSDDGLVMGLEHLHRPLFGVQFHPESVATEHGRRLLENFTGVSRGRAPEIRITARAPAPIPVELHHRRLDGWFDPAAAFAALYGDRREAFWLDSSRPDPGRARFSYMGDASGPLGELVEYSLGGPVRVTRAGATTAVEGDVLGYLEDRLGRLRVDSGELPFDFAGGYVGWLGYELKELCGSPNAHRSELPDAALLMADRVIAFDHAEGEVHLVALGDAAAAERWLDATEAELTIDETGGQATCINGTGGQATCITPDRDRAAYLRDVASIKRRLRDGETYEVCLTNTLRTGPAPPPLDLYAALRAHNPAPHAAYLRFGDTAVLSSSPERFLAIDRHGVVESRPIKGTAARAPAAARDAAARAGLAASAKDRAENLMIVDLTRNDLGRVCEPGTIEVPGLMELETYATVHHLVSTVRGRLRAGLGPVDCVRAAFPGGSMTGAPKLRTLEIIDELETSARGVYSGALGYLSLNGTADLSMVIRTIVRTPGGCSIGAGGAVVMDSDAEAEHREMLLKAEPLLAAIAAAAGEPAAAAARERVTA
jgi:para-aminobenzoate synthetase